MPAWAGDGGAALALWLAARLVAAADAGDSDAQRIVADAATGSTAPRTSASRIRALFAFAARAKGNDVLRLPAPGSPLRAAVNRKVARVLRTTITRRGKSTDAVDARRRRERSDTPLLHGGAAPAPFFRKIQHVFDPRANLDKIGFGDALEWWSNYYAKYIEQNCRGEVRRVECPFVDHLLAFLQAHDCGLDGITFSRGELNLDGKNTFYYVPAKIAYCLAGHAVRNSPSKRDERGRIHELLNLRNLAEGRSDLRRIHDFWTRDNSKVQELLKDNHVRDGLFRLALGVEHERGSYATPNAPPVLSLALGDALREWKVQFHARACPDSKPKKEKPLTCAFVDHLETYLRDNGGDNLRMRLHIPPLDEQVIRDLPVYIAYELTTRMESALGRPLRKNERGYYLKNREGREDLFRMSLGGNSPYVKLNAPVSAAPTSRPPEPASPAPAAADADLAGTADDGSQVLVRVTGAAPVHSSNESFTTARTHTTMSRASPNDSFTTALPRALSNVSNARAQRAESSRIARVLGEALAREQRRIRATSGTAPQLITRALKAVRRAFDDARDPGALRTLRAFVAVRSPRPPSSSSARDERQWTNAASASASAAAPSVGRPQPSAISHDLPFLAAERLWSDDVAGREAAGWRAQMEEVRTMPAARIIGIANRAAAALRGTAEIAPLAVYRTGGSQPAAAAAGKTLRRARHATSAAAAAAETTTSAGQQKRTLLAYALALQTVAAAYGDDTANGGVGRAARVERENALLLLAALDVAALLGDVETSHDDAEDAEAHAHAPPFLRVGVDLGLGLSHAATGKQTAVVHALARRSAAALGVGAGADADADADGDGHDMRIRTVADLARTWPAWRPTTV